MKSPYFWYLHGKGRLLLEDFLHFLGPIILRFSRLGLLFPLAPVLVRILVAEVLGRAGTLTEK